jgi:hypothetical protein
MSLYNMLFGTNPLAHLYLSMLGLTDGDTGRFRDCFLAKDPETGEEHIVIFTRNGGGNRDDYAGTTATLQSHPEYVRDFDDEFDCTYASYVFKVPTAFKSIVEKITSTLEDQHTDPGSRFQELLKKLETNDKSDPQVKHAIEVGEKILGPIVEHLKGKSNANG